MKPEDKFMLREKLARQTRAFKKKGVFLVLTAASVIGWVGGAFIIAWSSPPWERFIGLVIALSSLAITVLTVVAYALSSVYYPVLEVLLDDDAEPGRAK